jgi:hypothetical protein
MFMLRWWLGQTERSSSNDLIEALMKKVGIMDGA